MKRYFFVALLLTLSTSVLAHDGGLSVFLLGAEEAPGPGDPDGFGQVKLLYLSKVEQICFLLDVENIEAATAAHIHKGKFGVAGPVVVPLIAPTDGSSGGCVSVDASLINDITRHPREYYVNVHNATYPAGALRGQLPGRK